MSDVTQLLHAIDQGDPHAVGQALPLVYDELRRLAHQKLAHESAGQTLQATALVHDAYLRLVGDDADRHWDHRGHFFAAAATAMRRILIERARQKKRAVHGGGGRRRRQELQPDMVAAPEPDDDLPALDAALDKLAERDPVKARPPSARYRLGKFLRRNRGPVLAAGLVTVALLGGIVGTTFGLIRADTRRVEAEQAQDAEAQQRTKAEKARNRTRQALDAMMSSVTGDSLSTQKEISAEQKKFLTEVLTYYQEFAGEKADDEPSRASTAAAASRVGPIEYRLGRKVEAEAAIRLAHNGYEKLAADFPAVPAYRESLAKSHINLGNLLVGLGKGPGEGATCAALPRRIHLLAIPALHDFIKDLKPGHRSQTDGIQSRE